MDRSQETAGKTRSRQRTSTSARSASPDDTPDVTRRAAPAAPAAPAEPPSAAQATEQATDTTGDEPLDPRDPHVLARLIQRTPTGGYVVPEATLVRAIRAWNARGERDAVRMLAERLVDRCMPEFQRRSWGLRHRPALMEDAIAGMIEQLLREAMDPREVFMTQNFIHYLRCLCADNFSRVLRQEGLSYRRDEQGRPAGRPQHVPQALVDRIDVAAEDREDALSQTGVVADPRDGLEERMAAVEAMRILSYLPDPMDRQILVLRALEHMRWDDIAKFCGKTERTMRLRYDKAITRLRQSIEAEPAQTATIAR